VDSNIPQIVATLADGRIGFLTQSGSVRLAHDLMSASRTL
jgi:hypothetical protein